MYFLHFDGQAITSHNMNIPVLLRKDSISAKTDKSLCKYLLSPQRFQDLTFYKTLHNLRFPEANRKVTNRLFHLKNVLNTKPDQFLDHCHSYSILVPASFYKTSDSDGDDNSFLDNNSFLKDSDNDSYKEESIRISDNNNNRESNTFESPTKFPTEKMSAQASSNAFGKKLYAILVMDLFSVSFGQILILTATI